MKSQLTGSLRAVSLAVIAHVSSSAFAANYDQMIVFGDSLSDNGNVSTVLGAGVLPSLNYDASRFTDGPATTPSTQIVGVAVEQLNGLLGLPTLTPSILGGSNYAWARATTGNESLNPAQGITPGTGTQVAAYLSSHPQASPDSLYVLWAGTNDLLNGITTGLQAAETNAINHLTEQITSLLNAGARNILWFNLPDLSLIPAGQLGGPALAEQLHLTSVQFRQDWSTTIDSLRALHTDATITGVDSFAFLNSVVADPVAFGFTNLTSMAQGQAGINPDDYLFWDSTHPTTKAYREFASFAAQQLAPAAVPEPSAGLYFGGFVFGIILFRNWASKKRQPLA